MASWLDGVRAAGAVRRAQRALAYGEAAAAVEETTRARDLRPRWLEAVLWHAVALGEAGRVEEAASAFEQARGLRPGSPVVALWHGRLLIDQERFDDARAVLEAGSGGGTANLHLPCYLALATWLSDPTGDGADALDELERLWPQGGDGLAGRFLLEIEARFPGGPGTDFPASPEPPRTLVERIERWRVRRLVGRARKLHATGKPERAADMLERAAMIRPPDDEAAELAVLARRDAATRRRERLEADPHDVDLRLDAAEDLLEIGLPREALEVLEPTAEAIEKLDPHRLTWRAVHAVLLGRVLLDRDAPDEAVGPLERARELWPLEVEPAYYLGVAHLRAGRRTAARRCFIATCAMDHSLLDVRVHEYRAAG
jgi:Flp pilus assembly protein TadD